MLRFSLFVLVLFVIKFDVFSQKIIYPHNAFWSKIELNQLDNQAKWGLGLDFVYRRKSSILTDNMFALPLRESLRPWIHYQFSEYARFSLSPLGYMNTNEYIGKPEDFDREPFYELRTTFQFFHHIKQWNGRLMHTWRYRYELRWQEQPGEEDLRFFTRFRFRYRLRCMLNSTNFYDDKTLYLAGSNEFGLNLGRNVTLNTFNQNRLYLGIGYRFLNVVRAELRYIERFRTRGSNAAEFDKDRGFMIAVSFDSMIGIGKEKDYKVKYTD